MDRHQKPFPVQELLAVWHTVFTVTEVDGHIVNAVSVENDEVLLARFRVYAIHIEVAELNTEAKALE